MQEIVNLAQMALPEWRIYDRGAGFADFFSFWAVDKNESDAFDARTSLDQL
jgi:hypothetical protein